MKLNPWKKNPRIINKVDFERLKKQIKDLGIYKPLLAYYDKALDSYITLGGNMRLRAFRELNIQEVDVSIVNPTSEAEKLKYSLSDNDRAGNYVEEQLTELIFKYKDQIDLKNYSVDLGGTVNLDQYLKRETVDYQDLDNQLEDLSGLEVAIIKLEIPIKFKEKVEAWIAGDENKTPIGLGKGILRKCELL